jgi:hypothetical protein
VKVARVNKSDITQKVNAEELFFSPGVLRLGLGEFHNFFYLAPLGAAESRTE